MSSLPETLTSPPPPVPNVLTTFPAPHILLITLNRPKQLNAIPSAHHAAFAALYQWYDAEPSLRCAVLTGAGRAFCAGADLREWDARHTGAATTSSGSNSTGAAAQQQQQQQQQQPPDRWTPAGFGGLSNRAGRKPVVAAVNGLCLGGGMEMAINADLIVAAAGARFGLPEVSRGVVALAGGLPRLVRTVGRQRAAEMALLGRADYSAEQMMRWGLVNFVVPEGEDVVERAVEVAKEIAGNSPDAVIVSKEGLRLGWEGIGPHVGAEILMRGMYGRLDGGENMVEGVRSFKEKRKPVWKDSKL